MAINWALEVRLLHMRLVLLLGCSSYMFHYIGRKLIFLPLPLRRTFIFPSFIYFSPRTAGNKVIRRSFPTAERHAAQQTCNRLVFDSPWV
jgi:hypothetical protein